MSLEFRRQAPHPSEKYSQIRKIQLTGKKIFHNGISSPGADLGGGCIPPEMTCGFLIQLVFCRKKKTMWFIGVEVEQETSAPLLKKILDPPLISPSGVNKTDKTQASPEFNICSCIAPFLSECIILKHFLPWGLTTLLQPQESSPTFDKQSSWNNRDED